MICGVSSKSIDAADRLGVRQPDEEQGYRVRDNNEALNDGQVFFTSFFCSWISAFAGPCLSVLSFNTSALSSSILLKRLPFLK